MTVSIQSSNPVVKAVIEGAAPRPARLAAARGLLPLPHGDLLEVLVGLASSDDAELSESARESLGSQEAEMLAGTLASESASVSVLEYFAGEDAVAKEVHEAVIRNSLTTPSAVIGLAKRTKSADLLDILSLNQRLLIENPELIEAIVRNSHRSSEAERRATETRREFFEKERGQQQVVSELRAQGKEAAAEFIEQGTFEDLEDALFLAEHIVVPDSETDDSWLGLEYIEELYEETPEERQAIFEKILGDLRSEDIELESERVSTINRIIKMGMKERVKLATKGDREARNILIRDPNRIVAQAVINNPRITEQEVEKIATMRSVTEDILRQIAASRQWSRSYSIMHNLARNPRTPMANIMTIMTRLQLRDLVALSKNRNVSDAVRRHALRLSQARAGR